MMLYCRNISNSILRFNKYVTSATNILIYSWWCWCKTEPLLQRREAVRGNLVLCKVRVEVGHMARYKRRLIWRLKSLFYCVGTTTVICIIQSWDKLTIAWKCNFPLFRKSLQSDRPANRRTSRVTGKFSNNIVFDTSVSKH